MKTHSLLVTIVALTISLLPSLDSRAKELKIETFDHDPGWESFNNRMTAGKHLKVIQDFGYSATHFAGKERGEMGGQVWRATAPAFYAAKIPASNLNDKLSASGTFAITSSTGTSGVFFGWFSAKQPGGGRPVQSLGLDFDGEPTGARLAVRMISAGNKSCGSFITPFIPGKYRPTPIKHYTRYHWNLTYDPAAANGHGQFQFTIKADSDKPEAFEGKTFTIDVPETVRKEGATFDRFGLMNIGRSGNGLKIYFDDLEFNGTKEDFSHDPNWDGSGNRLTYEEANPPGTQNFGFSAETSFAGGTPGEIGGVFWRGEKNFGYYADRVGPLTLNDRIEASGKVILQIGAPDSGMIMGFFKSSKESEPPESNLLAIPVTGPTRIGHYFSPMFAAADGTKRKLKTGPIIVPGKVYDWKMIYDPGGNHGAGAVEVHLGDESVTLNLQEGDKARGATFDRFGLFTSGPGGGLEKIFFDDLKYTAEK